VGGAAAGAVRIDIVSPSSVGVGGVPVRLHRLEHSSLTDAHGVLAALGRPDLGSQPSDRRGEERRGEERRGEERRGAS
jgi:hypothetical protein